MLELLVNNAIPYMALSMWLAQELAYGTHDNYEEALGYLYERTYSIFTGR